ncbi:MAG TPA: acetate/propionate family kinase [Thermoanaerobaculia bacterium]|jgi:acetate kinase|nr:acetate/propionate family kinase [Thermoanaerobaculia bacterium]
MHRVLVLNAGSSSLKWSLLEATTGKVEAEGNEDWKGGKEAARAALERLRHLPAPEAIGHRLVHGGLRFREAVLLDDATRKALSDLAEIDPLHTGKALELIEAAFETFPELPQIAAFDTTFHATIPDAAAVYAVPYEWTLKWGLRRFGFHGLSLAYAVRRAGEMLGKVPERLVVCHLGSGCSVTAVHEGRSVDTTMGFTPLEGVMMGTRSGSVDPGLLLYLERQHGQDTAELEDALNQRSGLLGVSGVSGDLRQVLEAAGAGNDRAKLAYGIFVHTLRRAVGAMTGVLGGVDALVFTGGIGEHSARVRQDVAAALAFAGLTLDEAKNGVGISEIPDAEISASGAAVRALVITAREDLSVLAEARRVEDWKAGGSTKGLAQEKDAKRGGRTGRP